MVVDSAHAAIRGVWSRTDSCAHDYLAELDFGSGFNGRSIFADSYYLDWDGTPAVAWLGSEPPGLAEPLLASRMVVRAGNASAHQVKVKVLTMAGTVENAFTMDGDWDGFALSPARKYLYATYPGQTTDNDDMAALLRPTDGAILWQGKTQYALLARDDSHLVYVPSPYGVSPPRIRNLATGVEIVPSMTQEPFTSEPNIDIGLEAALAGRVVIKAAGYVLESRLLYHMDWTGTIKRLRVRHARLHRGVPAVVRFGGPARALVAEQHRPRRHADHVPRSLRDGFR